MELSSGLDPIVDARAVFGSAKSILDCGAL
jgi:hypothetical protein